MRFDLEKDKILALLISADLTFLLLHIIHTYTGLLPDSNFSIAQDLGYGEFFQYTKEFWIAILFLFLGAKGRKPNFFVFSSLFLYFLIDDFFEFHEKFGAFLAEFFNIQPGFGLRAVDFGELAVSGFFGALFIVLLGITYILSDHSTRSASKYVIAMVLLLALFGVLMDMVDILFEHTGASQILNMIEESGEMFVMSLITWFAFRLNLHDGHIPSLSLFGSKE